MKTQNLAQAAQSLEHFMAQIRAAHNDAIQSENRFAEIALFELITHGVELHGKMARVKDAAGL